jgi:hypothetical protein
MYFLHSFLSQFKNKLVHDKYMRINIVLFVDHTKTPSTRKFILRASEVWIGVSSIGTSSQPFLGASTMRTFILPARYGAIYI